MPGKEASCLLCARMPHAPREVEARAVLHREPPGRYSVSSLLKIRNPCIVLSALQDEDVGISMRGCGNGPQAGLVLAVEFVLRPPPQANRCRPRHRCS
jgi:hypothetical protein